MWTLLEGNILFDKAAQALPAPEGRSPKGKLGGISHPPQKYSFESCLLSLFFFQVSLVKIIYFTFLSFLSQGKKLDLTPLKIY